MKKLLLTIGFLLSLSGNLFAEKTEVGITPEKKTPPDTGTTRPRVPMRIPIQVFYDNLTREIEIIAPNSLDGYAYICDGEGDIITFSASLNDVLYIPECYSGLIHIYIESDSWQAVGEIIL